MGTKLKQISDYAVRVALDVSVDSEILTAVASSKVAVAVDSPVYSAVNWGVIQETRNQLIN